MVPCVLSVGNPVLNYVASVMVLLLSQFFVDWQRSRYSSLSPSCTVDGRGREREREGEREQGDGSFWTGDLVASRLPLRIMMDSGRDC